MLKLLSIVIPIYNEEKNIPFLYEKLEGVLQNFADRYDYEILFINDGSTDKSGFVIQSLLEKNPKIKYIEFSRNFGKEIATSCGIHYAKGDAAILLDADLQHPPELIPQFIQKWENGAEMVIGIREKNDGEGWAKKLGSLFFYRIMSAIGETKMIPKATDFRLIDRKVMNEFNRFSERNRMTRGLLDWLGFQKSFVTFAASPRTNGKASYSYLKLTKLALSSFVSHSLFPLKFAGYLGIIITLLGGILGMFIFIDRFFLKNFLGLAVTGTAILAIMILFLIGVVLICMGLIALYIGNIHQEVINRPMYVIRTTKNFKSFPNS